MAFFSKKVPKISPSSKRGTSGTSSTCDPSCHKGKIGLFRRRAPEAYNKPKQKQQLKQQQQPSPLPSPLPTTATATAQKYPILLANGDTFDVPEYEEAATIESTPTATPRNTNTMENDGMLMLSLPDLANLAFPPAHEQQLEHHTIPRDPPNHNRIHSHMRAHTLSDTRRDTNIHKYQDPSSLGLLPRPLPPTESSFVDPHNNDKGECEGEGENEGDNHICSLGGSREDLPPPVTVVCVPEGHCPFVSVLPPRSPKTKTRGCLSGPPPRALALGTALPCEWDDATIESECERESSTATTTITITARVSSEERERDKATAIAAVEAAAKIKPWIERAARLALLQNKACSSMDQQEEQKQQRQRQRRFVAPRIRRGALLASLEQGRTANTRATSNRGTTEEQQPRPCPPPSRIVKWHVVRHSSQLSGPALTVD